MAATSTPGQLILILTMLKMHGHALTRFFSDRRANVCLYGQHVSAVPHGHERASEWVAIDRTLNFYQTASPKKLDRAGPDT
jgi:hypothetical protein